MTDFLYDATAPKKPTNLSINSDLLRRARALEINLSQTLEESLAAKLRDERRRQWREENRTAFAEYNEFVAEHGAFSDGLRRF